MTYDNLTLEKLETERHRLLDRLAGVDLRRRALRDLIIERNRQAGVSKETVDRLRAKDVRLLTIRQGLQSEIGKLAHAIKAAGRSRHDAAARGCIGLARAFQVVVRRSVPRAQYDEWVAQAKSVVHTAQAPETPQVLEANHEVPTV